MNLNSGDIFLIPLSDGTFSIGQVIALEKRSLICVSCCLFDIRVQNKSLPDGIILDQNRCFSTLLVFRDYLLKKKWEIVGNQKLRIKRKYYPYEKELKSGGIGIKILEEELVQLFVNAFFGLEYWNGYRDPEYFDRLLLDKTKKPTGLIYKK